MLSQDNILDEPKFVIHLDKLEDHIKNKEKYKDLVKNGVDEDIAAEICKIKFADVSI